MSDFIYRFSEEEQVLSLIDIALANEGDDIDEEAVDVLDDQDDDTDVENDPPSPTFSEITLTENIGWLYVLFFLGRTQKIHHK